jgi:tetratricopeptide (TPR) repeat protein
MNHPKPSVLRNFLQSLSVADAGLVLHLLECPRCGRQGWSVLTPRPVRRRVGEPRLADPVEPEGYEAVLERLGEQAEDAAQALEEARKEAGPLLAELLALPPRTRLERVETEPRFHSFFVGCKLLELSWQTMDPREAEAQGRAVAVIADNLAGQGPSPGSEAGLAIGAWCAVGEALRRRRDWDGSEDAYRRAAMSLERSVDPAEAAEYCLWLARLRRDQRRTEEALALLERSASLAAGLGQGREQAHALVEMAGVYLDEEDVDNAVATFDRVLALGSAGLDPGLATGAGAGMAGCLASLGDPLQARRILSALGERPGRRRTAVDRSTLVRTEGLMAALSRQEHQAEVLLREAWNGFHRAGALGYAALVGLDLATLYLRQGRTSTLRALGAEIRLAFQSRTFAEGVRAALDDLIRALETGSTTQDLLAEIARYITRAIQQPDLPYPRAS